MRFNIPIFKYIRVLYGTCIYFTNINSVDTVQETWITSLWYFHARNSILDCRFLIWLILSITDRIWTLKLNQVYIRCFYLYPAVETHKIQTGYFLWRPEHVSSILKNFGLHPVNTIKCVNLFLKCSNFLSSHCRTISFQLLNITICLQRH